VSTDGRARDNDRTAAIALVQSAWSAGQIVDPDRDRRVEELRRAKTQTEIYLLTHDLTPPGVPATAAGQPGRYPTLAEVTAMSPGSGRPVSLRAPLLVAVATFVVGLAAVGSLLLARLADSAEDQPPGRGVLTAHGYGELIDAVEKETGSTVVFQAVIYPTYAVVETPVDRSSYRYESWYWDGEDLSSSGAKGTASSEPYPLDAVEGADLVDLVDHVKGMVDDPTTWYAVVRGPDRTAVSAYASNESEETEYVVASPDGTIVYDSTTD
jgi:hypothetical protein